MRIGFLFPHSLSGSIGTTRWVLGIARRLIAIGHEPFVITPFEKSQMIDGIRIVGVDNIFLKTGIGNSAYNYIRSMGNKSFFFKFILRKMIKSSRTVNNSLLRALKPLELDVLQVEHEPTAIPLLSTFDRLDMPIVLDFQGIWEAELISNKVIKTESSEHQMIVDKVREVVQSVDGILTWELMKEYAIEHYSASRSKICGIPFGTEPKISEIPPICDPPKIVYAGLLSREKNAELFLKSIPYVAERNNNARFYTTCKGDMIEELHHMQRVHGLKVSYFWFSDMKDYFEFLSTSSVGVLTLPNIISYRLTPPSKLFDYMSVGLPVVANDIGGYSSMIRDEGIGILTRDDPLDFSEAILRLIDHPETAMKHGQRGLDLVKAKYSWENVGDTLFSFYVRLSSLKS